MDWRGFMQAPWLRVKAAEVPLDVSRRAFIKGAAAVVAAASIMPVRAPLVIAHEMPVAVWVDGKLIAAHGPLYEEIAAVARQAFVPRLYAHVYKELPSLQLLLDHTEFVA